MPRNGALEMGIRGAARAEEDAGRRPTVDREDEREDVREDEREDGGNRGARSEGEGEVPRDMEGDDERAAA